MPQMKYTKNFDGINKMNYALDYMTSEYARTKMIESYDREAKEREEKELAAGMAAFALKTITEINERYIRMKECQPTKAN